MDMLEIEGVRIAYEFGGTGATTLSFVHGWCSHLGHWDAQVAALRPTHQVLRWDRRGMGNSQTEHPAESPDRHGHDLAALLDHVGVERTVVVGHAGGGPTAVAFAAQHPTRTEGLVLLDTRLYEPASGGEHDEFRTGIERGMARVSAPDGSAYLARLYPSFFGPLAHPDTVAAAVANALRTPLPVAAAELSHMASPTVAMAATVRCPVLWVSAQPEDTAAIRAIFPDAQVGHVVGSGHFVQVEVPEQFNAMLETFVSGLRR